MAARSQCLESLRFSRSGKFYPGWIEQLVNEKLIVRDVSKKKGKGGKPIEVIKLAPKQEDAETPETTEGGAE